MGGYDGRETAVRVTSSAASGLGEGSDEQRAEIPP
ncbi:hypothetical protein IWX81_001638 [Salinibacterium sp. CAN_S4]